MRGMSGRRVPAIGDATRADGRTESSRSLSIAAALLCAVMLALIARPAAADASGTYIQQGPKILAGEYTGSQNGSETSSSFGEAIALSADGDTAIVGSPHERVTGAARIFTRSGSTWIEQQKLTVNAHPFANFAMSVAISADGNTAVVGEPDLGDGPDEGAGAAWVFTRSGSTWTQQQMLTGGEEEVGEGRFGHSVALSADGETIAVGGYADNELTGAAWIFKRSGSEWSQQGKKLTGGEELPYGTNEAEQEMGGSFGESVSLSENGDTALIGGSGDDEGRGAAWAFTRSGAAWSQQGPKLTPSDESGAGGFGSCLRSTCISLSADGDTALIGGSLDEDEAGAAWVFTRSGTTWSQQGSKLTPSDETGKALVGSVALSGDGGTALIAGPADAGHTGAAWQFTRSGTTWTQQGSKFTGSEQESSGFASGEGGASFGTGIALSADGSTALFGGPSDHDEHGAIWPFAFESALAEEETPPGEEAPRGEARHVSVLQTLVVQSVPGGGGAVLGNKIHHGAAVTTPLGGTLIVHRGRVELRLRCSVGGAAGCSGELELTARRRARRGGRMTQVTLATARFAIAPGATTPVELGLSPAGRALLRGHHGHLRGALLLPSSSGGSSAGYAVQLRRATK
jgi:hypothetical protein